MSKTARLTGMVLATGLLLFSTYMYTRTGDWVALIFIVGSLAYGALFFSAGGGTKQ